jgi:hypothetical protein
MKILGLDVSTSITGICLLEKIDDSDPKILLLDHIDFKSCDGFWEKADLAKGFFESKKLSDSVGEKLDAIFIEESLQSFRTGLSSAATITTLAKFNSLVSYFARQRFSMDPNYIAATSARKLCGIKIQKTAACGKNAKEQTFEWALNGPLSMVEWPLKKNGQPKDWSRDATDAYVVARAGITQLSKQK